MDKQRIGRLEYGALIISILSITGHVVFVPQMLDGAGRDSWVAIVILGIPLGALYALILTGIQKQMGNQTIYELLQNRFGRIVSKLVLIPFFLFSVLAAGLTLRSLTDWSAAVFLPMTPEWAVAALFLAVGGYAALKGLQTIAYVNLFLLPAVILFGFFVSFATMPHKDYSQLLPVFQNGIQPYLEGGWIIGGILGEASLALFFLPLAKPATFKINLFLAVMGSFVLMGPVTGAIAILGIEEAQNLQFPSYEGWRMVDIPEFLERADFFAIYQWLIGAYTRLSICLLISASMLRSFVFPKQEKGTVAAVAGLVLVLVLLPVSNTEFHDWIKHYYIAFSWGTGIVLPLLLVVLMRIRGNKEAGHHEPDHDHGTPVDR